MHALLELCRCKVYSQSHKLNIKTMLLFFILLLFISAAVGLAWFFISHDHGEKEPIGMLWLAVFLGALGAVMAATIGGWVINAEDLLPGGSHAALLIAMLLIGVIEEACKFVPLSAILWKKRYFNEHTDGIIYFSLAGLGFGLPENILYTAQFGVKTGLIRMILTPIFHAATTGIVGYYLVKRKLDGKSYIGIWPILLAAMIIHGLYNFGLTSGIQLYAGLSVLITLVLSVALFTLYVRATELDQDMGLTTVGHNSFCRSCGAANPKKHLHCTQCGKNA